MREQNREQVAANLDEAVEVENRRELGDALPRDNQFTFSGARTGRRADQGSSANRHDNT